MISLLVISIRMYENAKLATPDDQPGDKGPKLRGSEEIHFEHCFRVRADRLVPDSVYAEFGDFPAESV